MTVTEYHYEDGSVDIIKVRLADIVAVTKIARSIRQAINKENEIKCSFVKIYTEIENRVRCNNCYEIFDEDIVVCPNCNTMAYLMQPFIQEVTA